MEMLFRLGLRGHGRGIGFRLLVPRPGLGTRLLADRRRKTYRFINRLVQGDKQAVVCTRDGSNISVNNYYLTDKNQLLLHRTDPPALLKSTYRNQTMLCRFERPVPSGNCHTFYFLFGRLNYGESFFDCFVRLCCKNFISFRWASGTCQESETATYSFLFFCRPRDSVSLDLLQFDDYFATFVYLHTTAYLVAVDDFYVYLSINGRCVLVDLPVINHYWACLRGGSLRSRTAA